MKLVLQGLPSDSSTKSEIICFPYCMCEHYIENTLIVSILICQTLCLMQLQTTKEIQPPVAVSSPETTGEGNLKSSFPPPQIPKCGVGGCPGSNQDWVNLSVAGRRHGQDPGITCDTSCPCQRWGKESPFLGQGVSTFWLAKGDRAVLCCWFWAGETG